MVGVGLFVLALWSVTTADESLKMQSKLAQQRLQKTVSTIVERAHIAEDDLAMQETIHGLGEAPGILFSGVVGKDGLFLAHSQPALLGKPFHRTRLPVIACPLGEGISRWGILIYALLDPSARQGLVHQAVVCTVGALLFWAAWMVRGWNWRQTILKLEEEKIDLSKELSQRQANLANLEKNLEDAENLWAARLQEAVNKIPQGVIVLDQNQRIRAVNSQAASSLGIPPATMLLGKSWLDAPVLQTCGSALEKSLAAPDQTIEWPIQQTGLSLHFHGAGAQFVGTWVTFFESKELVK
jgi:PAS domain-containing protein